MRMNFATMLLLASCLNIYADGFGQRITLSEKNIALDKILDKVEKQSGYYFWLQTDLLTKSNKVTLNLKNASLEALSVIEPVVKAHNLTLIETAFRWLLHHSELMMGEKGSELVPNHCLTKHPS